MNKLKFAAIAAVIAAGLFIVGCNKADNSNAPANNANKAVTNTNAGTNSNANAVSANMETKADSSSTGSMATPTDTYKTAYAARQKKDIEGLKKVMSKDILEFLTEMGKMDKKSLDDMLKDLVETPQAATNASRNEKIDGDHATLEYQDEKGEWKTMDFEKVGSDWKMAQPKGAGKSEGKSNK